MARFFGVDIPDNKTLVISLTHIYGIGKSIAKKVISQTKIDIHKKVKDLTDDELTEIRKILSQYKVEGDVRTEKRLNIKRLMEIGCHRGIYHRKKLPVRGQRTRSNARTAKGPRKTVANKKKAPTSK